VPQRKNAGEDEWLRQGNNDGVLLFTGFSLSAYLRPASSIVLFYLIGGV
jgi:hypothetical protein